MVLTVKNIRCDNTIGNEATMKPNIATNTSCTLNNVTDMLKMKASCDDNIIYLFIKDSHFNLFPHVFEYYPKLQSVDVTNAGIQHIESTTFDLATNLTHLDMEGSNMSTLGNNLFSHASNLTTIDMCKSSIVTIEKHAFQGLSNLKNLDLSENLIGKLDAAVFQPLSLLETVRLSNNKIEILDADLFTHNTKLKWAYFDNNNIIAVQENSFVLCRLKSLDLGSNKLQDVDVTTLKYLMDLNVANNLLQTLKIPPTVENMHAENNRIAVINSDENNRLLRLYLSTNNFANNLRNLTNLDKLKVLDLSNNHMRNIEFSDLKHLPQLEELKLWGNKLSEFKVEAVIANLPTLKMIELSTIHWSDSFVKQLENDLKSHNIELGQDRTNISDDGVPIVTTIRPSTATEKSTVHPAIPTPAPDSGDVEKSVAKIIQRLDDLERKTSSNAAESNKDIDDRLTKMQKEMDDKISKSNSANNAEYYALISTFKTYEAIVIIMFVSCLSFVIYKAIVYSRSLLSSMRYRRAQSSDPLFSEQDL